MIKFFLSILQPVLLLFSVALSYAYAADPLEPGELLKRIAAAYAQVNDYQTKVTVKVYKNNGPSETEKFLYTFKKPNQVRIDFESPHPGLILAYPDKNGKVIIRPPGLAHLLKLYLAPDNTLLIGSSGQRIDQTEMRILIKNIEHSLTDQRRGPLELAEENGFIRIRVLSDDHFRKGEITFYQFFIDKVLFLPIRVEESTPDGRHHRIRIFDNLKINTGISDDFFQLE